MKYDLSKLTEQAKEGAETIKALAHETRLLIICSISHGEKTVLELEQFLSTTQSNVSQHLAKMRDKGILLTRKQGNQVYYRVKDEKILKLVNVLQDCSC